jgi:hypothetical protein
MTNKVICLAVALIFFVSSVRLFADSSILPDQDTTTISTPESLSKEEAELLQSISNQTIQNIDALKQSGAGSNPVKVADVTNTLAGALKPFSGKKSAALKDSAGIPAAESITNQENLSGLSGFLGFLDSGVSDTGKETEAMESQGILDSITKGKPLNWKPTFDKENKTDVTVSEFEQTLLQKIETLRTEIEAETSAEENFVVLDAVDFTRQMRVIHLLLNPPPRLHPWLKWLLYASRLTPKMLEFYYAALAKRDQIYELAAQSNGKLKIRYQGKILNVPIFVWPDQAEGSYELIMVSNNVELPNQNPVLPAVSLTGILNPAK